MIFRSVSALFGSRGLTAWLPCLVLLSCQVHSSGPTDVAVVEARRETAGIPDAVLKDHGLESLWRLPGATGDNPTLRVTLLAEGLLVTTQPTPERKGRLRLFNRGNGEALWSCELEHALRHDPVPFRYPPGIAGKPNELYFTQLDTVHVLDLRYSDTLQKVELPFPISTSIAPVDDRYFVGSDNGRVYGVRKTSHVEDWSYRTGGNIVAAPVVGSSSVLVGSTDGSLYSLSPVAGWVRGSSWKFDAGAGIVCRPVPYSQWVIVGSTDYKLYCLEERDGSVFWSFLAEAPIEDAPVVFSFRPGQEIVYCIGVGRTRRSEKRTLFSVKLRDGQYMWRRPGVRSVVSMGKEHLYVLNDPAAGEGRTLSALDVMTGSEKFRLDVGQFHFVPTNDADHGRNQAERGRIYLIAQDGTMQVIAEKS